MKKLLILLAASLIACSVWAQNEPMGGPASQAYREYRTKTIEPTFSITAVKQKIAKLKRDSDDNLKLSAAEFNRMTVPQRFTYSMIHGEQFSQNCEPMPIIVDEEKKIFAELPGAFDEESWSQQQLDFLHHNRGPVIVLIRRTMQAKHRLGVAMKQAIVELKAKELVPDAVALYKRDRKDHDILTMLNLLMRDAKYPPFMASASFKKLYGSEANYKSSLVASRANQDLVISRALAFYRG